MKETSVKETHLYDSTCNVLKRQNYGDRRERAARGLKREGRRDEEVKRQGFFRAVKQP